MPWIVALSPAWVQQTTPYPAVVVTYGSYSSSSGIFPLSGILLHRPAGRDWDHNHSWSSSLPWSGNSWGKVHSFRYDSAGHCFTPLRILAVISISLRRCLGFRWCRTFRKCEQGREKSCWGRSTSRGRQSKHSSRSNSHRWVQTCSALWFPSSCDWWLNWSVSLFLSGWAKAGSNLERCKGWLPLSS